MAIDYSIQLPDINEPQQGKGGQLLLAAGERTISSADMAGKAKAMEGENNARALLFGAQVAGEAYKGYKTAKLSNEIDAVLKNTEGIGPGTQSQLAFTTPKNEDYTLMRPVDVIDPNYDPNATSPLFPLPNKISNTASNPAAGPTNELASQINVVKGSAEQGLIDPAEARARIAAMVQDYSASMPGWASDFRKVAANQTGIAAIDVYQAHSALTQKSTAEKMRDLNLAYIAKVADAVGKPPSAVTEADMLNHRMLVQAENDLKLDKAIWERRALGLKHQDELGGQMVSRMLTTETAPLMREFETLVAANRAGNPVALAEQSAKISGMLNRIRTGIVQQINLMTSGEGPNRLSMEGAKEQVARVDSLFKTWDDALKNTKDYSLFDGLVKASQGRLDMFLSTAQLLNPEMTMFAKWGVASELVKAGIIHINDPKRLDELFGPKLGAVIREAVHDPNFQNIRDRIMSGETVTLSEIAKVNPKLAQGTAAEAHMAVKGLAKEAQSDPKKNELFQNFFKTAYGSEVGSNFKVENSSNLDRYLENAANPDVIAAFGAMPKQNAVSLLFPISERLQGSMANIATQVQTSLAKINNPLTTNNKWAENGWQWQVVQDPFTKNLKLEVTNANDTKFVSNRGDVSRGDTIGAAVAVRKALGEPPLGSEIGATINNIRQQLDLINKQADALSATNQLLRSHTGNVLDSGKVTEGVLKSITSPPKYEFTDPGPMPEVKVDKVTHAIRAAEMSYSEAGMGESPKKAKGPFQITEATAIDPGLGVKPLVINKEKGIDERMDFAKSQRFAIEYITALLKRYEGNWEKAAAAYNAGLDSVDKAIAKAAARGMPENWLGELPKPKETVPYVRRFMMAMNEGDKK